MRLLLLALLGWPLLVRADWWWPASGPRPLAEQCETLAVTLDETPPTAQGPTIAAAHSAIAQGQWLALNHHQASWRRAGADCELLLTLALDRLDSHQATDPDHPLVAARLAAAPRTAEAKSARRELNSAVSAYARQLSSANQQPLTLAPDCPPVTAATLADYLAGNAPPHCRSEARQRWQQRASQLGGASYTALLYARQQLAAAEGEPSWRHWRGRDALLSPADVNRLLLALGRRHCPSAADNNAPQPAATLLTAQLTLLEQRLGLTMTQQPLSAPALRSLPLIALQLQWPGHQSGPRWLLLDLFARPGKAVKRPQMMPLSWNSEGQLQAVAVSAALPDGDWSSAQQLALIDSLANGVMAHRPPQAADLKGLWGALAQHWWLPQQQLQPSRYEVLAAALVTRSHRQPLIRDGGNELVSNSLRTLQLSAGTVVAAQLWASPTMLSDDALAYRPLWLALLASRLTVLSADAQERLLATVGSAAEKETLLEVLAVPDPQTALTQLLAEASCAQSQTP